MGGGVSPWILMLGGVTLRWMVTFFSYSGEGNPPMYGDYEAQRHWMEVTVNLPVKEWYVDSVRNDLQYWGLDYPPLTAYHSLICGYIARFINPSYVVLNESRGLESPEHKLFMRSTVIVSDLITYIPAARLFSKAIDSDLTHLVLLTYPGIILIDHGHFQYNCVSLGLALFALVAFFKNKDILGSVLFCLALNFKQMLLYYSLPVFFYLLGKSLTRGWRRGLVNCVLLGLTVSGTFLLLWFPFSSITIQVIKRIFPIERGLFEDKVSNFWCIVNIFVKVRNYFNNSELAAISAGLTLFFVLPSSLNLFLRPTQRSLILALINSSLGFFLFSYQVHEKTILLVSLPVMLFFQQDPLHCLWFLGISSLSMLPLLLKDDLFIPFFALNVFYVLLLSDFIPEPNRAPLKRIHTFKINTLISISTLTSLILIVSVLTLKPPDRFPDLFPLLISAYCAIHFIYFFVYFNWTQLMKRKIS